MVPHFVGDDARLAGVLARCFRGRQPAGRARGVEGAEAQAGELENEPLAFATLDAGGWWTRRPRPHGGDTPPAPVEAAPDPATAHDDRRTPLPQGGVEIERSGLDGWVRHTTRERGNVRGGKDFPQRHDASRQRNSRLPQDLPLLFDCDAHEVTPPAPPL